MDVLTLLIVVTLLIIVIINNSSQNDKIGNLLKEIANIKWMLQEGERNKFSAKKEEVQPLKREEAMPSNVGNMNLVTEITPPKPVEVKPKTVIPDPNIVREPARKPETVKPVKLVEKPKVRVDLEKFIGENLISKIGIIILVLGVGYFVKYAIDQNWINEIGRVAIGVLVGGALITLAHRMRITYKTFSSLLTGGGFAVLYLTIAIAFHEYQLFSQSVAFLLLVVITIFSVILSLAYDKKELAIFSQFGGYAAPFMISTGEGNYVVLFSYILILNAGLIVLAYFKRWHVLNILAYIFTIVIFSGWLINAFYFKQNPPYAGAMVFASIFYLVFFVVNILNNLREKKPFNGVEISLILSNNLFYFLAGLAILQEYRQGIFRGAFTVLVAVYNFGWVLYLYRKQQIDKNLIYLMVGLVMSYVSLAIPIQLNGHSITLFWTAEFVILLWLSQISKIRLLKTGHLIILGLIIISLTMDWVKLYGSYATVLPVILNRAFITGLVVIIGLGASQYFLKKEVEEPFIPGFLSIKTYRSMLSTLLFVFTYLVFFLELSCQMNNYYPSISFRHVVYGIFNFAFLLTILIVVKQLKWMLTFRWFFYIALIGLFIYLVYYNPMVLEMRDTLYFGTTVSLGNFLFHYLVFPFIIWILVILVREKQNIITFSNTWSKVVLWYIAFFCIFALSAELDNVLLLLFAKTSDATYAILEMSHKVGYPVLWGVCAFLLILWGIQFKNKDYRILALSLFSLIILKMFLFDVWKMNEGGRIASFIFLGVILLVVSFLYQKLKRFITDDNHLTGKE